MATPVKFNGAPKTTGGARAATQARSGNKVRAGRGTPGTGRGGGNIGSGEGGGGGYNAHHTAKDIPH